MASRALDNGIEGVDGQLGGHPLGHRVADDVSAAGVFDGAQVELAFGAGVFGDVGQPQLVEPDGGEAALHEIVVDRRPRFAGRAALLGVDRPQSLLSAEPIHPVPAGEGPGQGARRR